MSQVRLLSIEKYKIIPATRKKKKKGEKERSRWKREKYPPYPKSQKTPNKRGNLSKEVPEYRSGRITTMWKR